jgi:diaminohydroxyphosphoribosylaminopyrimidine deaminase / 5-amino-6-(5-phosphoribosylamino)uracil reductase
MNDPLYVVKKTPLDFIKLALSHAQCFQGFTQPNPAVGAVLVSKGQVISFGAHQKAGEVHAEVIALSSVESAEGCDLYVTLEPCCHFGRTPPCTELIIKKRVKRVFYAFRDPNPKVSGNGAEQLRAAGIDCEFLFSKEVQDFYRAYAFWVKYKRPWVTLKMALTADGMIATQTRSPLVITEEAANQYTHQRRKQSGALLTTVATVIADDPSFNVRLGDQIIQKTVVVLDRCGRLPLDAKVFQTAEKIILFYSKAAGRIEGLAAAGVQCFQVNEVNERLDLLDVMQKLGEIGFHDVWVEVGAQAFGSFLTSAVAQEVVLYFSDKNYGKIGYFFDPVTLLKASCFECVTEAQLGCDLMHRWLLKTEVNE